MNSIKTDKLAIGCAQFGSPYGVANKTGKVAILEVAKILDYAKKINISTLDTAISYGTSEAALGEVGVGDWLIVSKLPALPTGVVDIHSWIISEVNASLNRLNITSLGGLLLHNPSDLLGENGKKLVNALDFLRAHGIVRKVGISIYQPQELQQYFNVMSPEIVQSPFNVLDHRLITSGWAEKLHKKNIEVHVRSVFLQGLLLVKNLQRSPYFDKWQPIWDRWDLILKKNNLSPIQACLNDVMFNEFFDKVIVGVDGLSQLVEIKNSCKFERCGTMEDISVDDVSLLHPSNWK